MLNIYHYQNNFAQLILVILALSKNLIVVLDAWVILKVSINVIKVIIYIVIVTSH